MTRRLCHTLPAVGWTLLLCVLMLSPGEATFAGDVSQAFGGTEFSDAIGHVFLAGMETALVFHALRQWLRQRTALTIAAVFTTALGAVFEIAQLWIPFRGASSGDFAANVLGVALGVGAVLLWQRRTA